MTDATSKIVTALVAALICVAGGLFTFVLALSMLPPTPATTPANVDRMLREERFDPAAVNRELPEDVVAVWVDPNVLAQLAPGPPSNTGPTPSTGPADGEILDPPATKTDDEREDPPGDEQPTVQPTVPELGPGAPTQPPSWKSVGRVVRIDDSAQLVALDHIQETSTLTTTRIKDGVWLTISTPQTGHSTAATLAIVTALTGAAVALVIAVLRPSRRPRTAGAVPPDAPWRPGGRPPTPEPLPPAAWQAAAIGARESRSAGPRGAAGLTPRPVTPQPPSPDPRVPALLTQRTTLVRGLADLAAKLPAEFEWQATNALDAAGVQRIVPDGAMFDPAAHHVVGTEPPPDAQLDDTVARTLRPGWEDRGQVIVPARVVLYTLPEQPRKEPDDDSS